ARFGDPVVLQVPPSTAHRVAMHTADVIMRSNHRARETFQDETEPSRRDVETARLKPDTVRVRNPQMFIVEIRIRDEVFAASLIRLKAIGKTVERGNWHVFFYRSRNSRSMSRRNGNDKFTGPQKLKACRSMSCLSSGL